MSRIRRASALIPMPKQYVSSVLKKINLPCGALWTGRPSTSTPYWSHSLLDYYINLIGWKAGFVKYTLSESRCDFIGIRALIRFPDLHKDIRKRALRKKERDAAAAKKQ